MMGYPNAFGAARIVSTPSQATTPAHDREGASVQIPPPIASSQATGGYGTTPHAGVAAVRVWRAVVSGRAPHARAWGDRRHAGCRRRRREEGGEGAAHPGFMLLGNARRTVDGRNELLRSERLTRLKDLVPAVSIQLEM